MKSKAIKNKDNLKEPTKLINVIKPKLLSLIMQSVTKNPKDSQIELVHYLLEMTNIVITNGELRNVMLDTELNGLKDLT